MSAENETIADIAAFIRKCLDLLDNELSRKSNGETSMSAEALLCPVLNAKAALDRLDAAWKREHNSAPKSPAPTTCGNAAAQREALSLARNVLAKWSRDTPFRAWNEIGAAIDKCDAALSEPPRNCDIFTTGAKINEGIREWCRNHDCDKCPFLNDGCDSCYASWMLSTATEGGAK